MRKGYIHIYTGDSKGKTTAALGLALRAMGAGLKIFVGQFLKRRVCSEHKALERFKDLITIKQYGTGFLKGKSISSSEKASAKKGLEEIKKAIASEIYDIVILDEINVAVHYKILPVEDVLDLLDARPSSTEIILTGRYADDRIMEKADLVTEMKKIKHYKDKGVRARVGIEK